MRIISSFSDYYDSLQDYQDSIVWVRESKSILEKDIEFKDVDSKLNLSVYKHTLKETWRLPFILGYCGEYLKFYVDTKLDKTNDNFENLLERKNKLESYLPNKENEKKSYFYSPFYQIDVNFLKQYDLFVRYNTPIFLIHTFGNYKIKGLFVYTNPSFIKLGLTNYKHISQTYQDLDMFVSGVLSNNFSHHEVIDKYRQGARFDKYSFRKLPEKSK